jgi:inner membrane protein
MVGRTHQLIGFTSFVTIGLLFPPQELNMVTLSTCVIGNVVGSLLPDIDGAGNRLWDLLPAGNLVGKFARRLFYKHRTITHSLLGGFLIYKALWFILPKLFNPEYVNISLVFTSIMIGFVAHLLADMMTKDGIPLLFPFKWYFGIPPLSFLRMRTGGFVENFIVFPGVVVFLGYMLFSLRDTFFSLIHLVRS